MKLRAGENETGEARTERVMAITRQKQKRDISHFVTILLGFIVLVQCHYLLAVMYVIISVMGLMWFLGTICPHCRAYGTPFCKSGYGRLSARLFKKPKEPNFRRAFKRNIVSVTFQWFIPLVAGVWCLYTDYTDLLLITFIMFILVAFIWLPLGSRQKGCKNCPQRDDCSWAPRT